MPYINLSDFKMPTVVPPTQYQNKMGAKATTPTVTPPSNTLPPKYTAPTQPNGMTADQKAQYDKTVGLLSSTGGQGNFVDSTGKVQPTTPAVAPTASYPAPKPQTKVNTPSRNTTPSTPQNQGYLTQLADQSQKRNLELANRAQDIATTAGQQISNIGQQGSKGAAGYRTTGTSPVAEGNAAILAQTTAAQQQAVAQGANMELQGVQQGLSAQGQTQSALNQAQGYVQPVAGATFFGSPQTGGLVGGASTGAITGTTGNTLIDASVDKAYQMIRNGTSYNDALSTLVGGPVAQQALLARLNSGQTFNPTAQNAAVQANLNIAGDYSKQAADLSKNIDTFKAQGDKVVGFLDQIGINKNSNLWTNGIFSKNILPYLSPSAKAIADQYFNELQVSTSQIIGLSCKLTPTAASEMSSVDFLKAMTPQELESYISYIDSLGQTTLGEFQDKATLAGTSSGFYQGSAANPNVPTFNPPVNPLSSTALQFGGANLGKVGGLVSGFLSKIFSNI